MTRAVGSVRVSTDEQSETGVSLAAQEAKLRAYCDLYGIELMHVFVDAGESGKSLDRPGKALASDGIMLIPCQKEQEVLVIIRELRTAGMTLMGIAAELNRRGIQRREGGPWEHTFISRILKKTAA
jgi:Resolvase, N terminal domain/Recombinase